MGSKRNLRTLAVCAVGVIGLAVPVAAQADVASLTGEVLTSGGPGSPNGIPVTTYNCNPSGTSNFAFSTSGVAVGPYPGTFTETGTATMGPADPTTQLGPVTSFQAQFTITSATGTVTGTKTLASNPLTAVAFCNQIGGQLVADATYQAHISTPTGSADDQGTANTTQFNMCPDTATCGTIGNIGSAFYESFASTNIVQGPPPPPPAPTTTAECKNGGWKNYTALGFKNQGDCVSFVASKGKNQAG